MRRLFLCFLLCLMPLRLWAGAWMPMAQTGVHPAAVLATASPAQHTQAIASHDCHEATAEPLPQTHAQLALHAVPVQAADCHDGHCQLCSVCHQGLSLTAWPLVVPVFQAHLLPVSATWAHEARMSGPLTKPPIS
jgi:hypothetical protein